MSLKLDLLAVVFLVGLDPPTQAHDIYSHLKDWWGNSCCDDQDCRPVPYRVTPTGVQMLVYGDWIAVPDHVIQYRALPGDTGETAGGIGAAKSATRATAAWTVQLSAQSCRPTPPRSRGLPLPFEKVASGLFHKGASEKYGRASQVGVLYSPHLGWSSHPEGNV